MALVFGSVISAQFLVQFLGDFWQLRGLLRVSWGISATLINVAKIDSEGKVPQVSVLGDSNCRKIRRCSNFSNNLSFSVEMLSCATIQTNADVDSIAYTIENSQTIPVLLPPGLVLRDPAENYFQDPAANQVFLS